MTFIISAIFFALMILFLLPFGAGIINIGNISGAFVSGLLATAFMFHKKFLKMLSERTGRAFLLTAGFILALCIITGLAISIFMVREMNDRPECETTVVVLGCQVNPDGASLMLQRRLDTACNYLLQHENIKVIVSGGKGDDEPISEAQCMYDWLVRNGISPERIYIEDKSTNTQENIRFSKEIIERENLCPEITIVTDGYHQLRADMFARREGITSYNISAPTALWLLPTYWVREWFGIIYYTIF